jgi:High potential iron-sulfur protein
MSQQQPGTSRRTLIRAAIGCGSAALLLRIAPAHAAEQMTRAQAEYQDTPNGIYSCGTCTLFVPPNGCKVVEGDVSKDGWCKAYAMAD